MKERRQKLKKKKNGIQRIKRIKTEDIFIQEMKEGIKDKKRRIWVIKVNRKRERKNKEKRRQKGGNIEQAAKARGWGWRKER